MVASKGVKTYPFTPLNHLDKACCNEKFAHALFDLEIPCCDWVITVIFYSALHYCYSKLPINNIQPSHPV